MLDVCDFRPAHKLPEFGAYGQVHVRYGKSKRHTDQRQDRLRTKAVVKPDTAANTQDERRDNRATQPARDADEAQIPPFRRWTRIHVRLRLHTEGEGYHSRCGLLRTLTMRHDPAQLARASVAGRSPTLRLLCPGGGPREGARAR